LEFEMHDRFAILLHDWPEPHLDLLLQHGDSLRAWRISPALPILFPCLALPLPNHRLIYLDYTGPISGNRGTVQNYDRGTLQWLHISEDDLQFYLEGRQLRGTFRLQMRDGRWELQLGLTQLGNLTTDTTDLHG